MKAPTPKLLATAAVLVSLSVFSVRPASAHAVPHLTTTQKHNLQNLRADLASIRAGSQITRAQINALRSDLSSIVRGATKPDPALVQQFATDFSSALADGSLSKQERAKLIKDFDAVLNSANVSDAQIQTALADAKTILVASGVTQSTAQEIRDDLKAIVAEAKTNLP